MEVNKKNAIIIVLHECLRASIFLTFPETFLLSPSHPDAKERFSQWIEGNKQQYFD